METNENFEVLKSSLLLTLEDINKGPATSNTVYSKEFCDKIKDCTNFPELRQVMDKAEQGELLLDEMESFFSY